MTFSSSRALSIDSAGTLHFSHGMAQRCCVGEACLSVMPTEAKHQIVRVHNRGINT